MYIKRALCFMLVLAVLFVPPSFASDGADTDFFETGMPDDGSDTELYETGASDGSDNDMLYSVRAGGSALKGGAKAVMRDMRFTGSVSARRYVLINADNGAVICGGNYSERSGMASTTKIMTALVALENADTDCVVTVSANASGIEGSSIYLEKGERLRLIDLLYATMLASANDAAAATAEAVGGTIASFVGMMNEKATELGLTDTHFDNPHGLDGETHYTSALDLARLAAYAMDIPEFADIVSHRNYTFTTAKTTRTLTNHNRMLYSYEGASGVKTGFTKACGRCLVSAAERNGQRLICVTLNASDDWNDHRKLLDFGFSATENVILAEAGELSFEIPVVNGDASAVICKNTAEYRTFVLKGTVITRRDELDRMLWAGIEEGEKVGRVVYLADGEIIAEIPITATTAVGNTEYKMSLWQRICGFFSSIFGG